MSNNISQKNIIYASDVKTDSAYYSAVNAVNGKAIDYQASPFAAESINNEFQQLVDNDIYVEQQLIRLSSYSVGPKRYDSETIESLNSGYKLWGLQQDSELSILRKTIDPISSTMFSLFGDAGVSVYFVKNVGGAMFAGSSSGLHYSEDGEMFAMAVLSGAAACYGYFSERDVTLFAAENGIYQQVETTSLDEYDVPFVSRRFVRRNMNDLHGCRSVAVNWDMNRIFVGTSHGIYVAAWSNTSAADMFFESCVLNGETRNFDEAQTNQLVRVNHSDFVDAENNIIAATDSGLFHGQYEDAVAGAEKFVPDVACTCYAKTGSEYFVGAEDGVYDMRASEKAFASDSKIFDVKISGNTLYAVSNQYLYVYNLTTHSVRQVNIGAGARRIELYTGNGRQIVFVEKTNGRVYSIDMQSGHMVAVLNGKFCMNGSRICAYKDSTISAYAVLAGQIHGTDRISSFSNYALAGRSYSQQNLIGVEQVSQGVYDVVKADGIYRDGSRRFSAESVSEYSRSPVSTYDIEYLLVSNSRLKAVDEDYKQVQTALSGAVQHCASTQNLIFASNGRSLSVVSKNDVDEILSVIGFTSSISNLVVDSAGRNVYLNSGGNIERVYEYSDLSSVPDIPGLRDLAGAQLDVSEYIQSEDDEDEDEEISYYLRAMAGSRLSVSLISSDADGSECLYTKEYEMTVNSLRTESSGASVKFTGSTSSGVYDFEFDVNPAAPDAETALNGVVELVGFEGQNVNDYLQTDDYDFVATNTGLSAIRRTYTKTISGTGIKGAKNIKCGSAVDYVVYDASSLSVYRNGSRIAVYPGAVNDLHVYQRGDGKTAVLVAHAAGLSSILLKSDGTVESASNVFSASQVKYVRTISADVLDPENIVPEFGLVCPGGVYGLKFAGTSYTPQQRSVKAIAGLSDALFNSSGDGASSFDYMWYVSSGKLYSFNFKTNAVNDYPDVPSGISRIAEEIADGDIRVYALNSSKKVNIYKFGGNLAFGETIGQIYSGVYSMADDGVCIKQYSASEGNTAFTFCDQIDLKNGKSVGRQLLEFLDGALVYSDGVYVFGGSCTLLAAGKHVKIELAGGETLISLTSGGKLQVRPLRNITSVSFEKTNIKSISLDEDDVFQIFDNDGRLYQDLNFSSYVQYSSCGRLVDRRIAESDMLKSFFGVAYSSQVVFLKNGVVYYDDAVHVHIGRQNVAGLDSGVNTLAASSSGTIYAAKDHLVYKLENSEFSQLTAQVDDGQISRMAVSDANVILLLKDGTWRYLTSAGFMNLSPPSGANIRRILEVSGDVNAVVTSKGLFKANYKSTYTPSLQFQCSKTLPKTIEQAYLYGRALAALCLNSDGTKTLFSVSVGDSAMTYSQAQTRKLDDTTQIIDVSELDALVYAGYNGGFRFYAEKSGTRYFMDPITLTRYPDIRLDFRTPVAADYSGKYYMFTDDGAYASSGQGKAYVFRHIASTSLANKPVYCVNAASEDRYLIGASDGTYVLANDGHDLSASIYRSSIQDSPTRYIGKTGGSSKFYIKTIEGSLYRSDNAKKWTEFLDVRGCENCFVDQTQRLNVKVFDVYTSNSYEYYIATSSGLIKTEMKYSFVNDVERFTLAKGRALIGEMQPEFDEEYDEQFDRHIDEKHYAGNSTQVVRNLIPVLNEQYLGVNMDGIQNQNLGVVYASDGGLRVDNDLVYECQFGDRDDGEVHVDTSNFVKSDNNVECSYILKRYTSGLAELYIYIPTTNTYYLNHTAGSPNCMYSANVIKRENLVSFGSGVQNTASSISSHYTAFSVYVEDTLLSVGHVLDVQVNGNSLPLKIYKDREYGENEDSASMLYHSHILQSQCLTEPQYLQKNEYGEYVFDFACFGSDAQAVRIMCYDPVKDKDGNTFTVKYHGNGASGSMAQQKFYIGLSKKLRINKFTWPASNDKIFYGWTTSANPKDDEVDLPDLYQDGCTFCMDGSKVKAGQTVNLYAAWLTHQFDENDTLLVSNPPSGEIYMQSGGIIPDDEKRVIIKYGD